MQMAVIDMASLRNLHKRLTSTMLLAATRRARQRSAAVPALLEGCRTHRLPYILGIETSCDDTAAAVLDRDGNVLSNVISSQWELNAKWKGKASLCRPSCLLG